MMNWLRTEIIDQGRLPLLCFLLGFVVAFVFIRISVRMIRAKVRWWPGNITPGGLHVHHMVFGVITMVIAGGGLISVYEVGSGTVIAVFAALFGIGAALTLDEFALIFYLHDVYWEEEGRVSVDAVFVAIAVTGMLLLGLQPLDLVDLTSFDDGGDWVSRFVLVVLVLLNLLLAGVVLAKGKIWTGLVGLFIVPLLWVGALRLSRPGAPWARWRYQGKTRKMTRAIARERRFRRPVIRAKIFVQDLVAGAPTLEAVLGSVEHSRVAAEAVLDRTVHPAPAPGISPNQVASGTIDRLPRSGTPT
ncbi:MULTISPECIES: hypothetical protein [unclassified Rhodococcus (in: high G+C Gram-positive bacteria)]|uniref:hypothetical protein n=1 Tax=Rhodococcus sp. SJ-3 TaxID=3454628 RepID=UPI002DA1BFCB|nr:hypothetical protein [Rhodococcus sp. (in: high G+C Gram-positive bacteria)]